MFSLLPPFNVSSSTLTHLIAVCAGDANCAGYAQAPRGGACYYITTDGRCDYTQSWGDRFHYYNTNGDGYVVGNAQCGFLSPKAGLPTTS